MRHTLALLSFLFLSATGARASGDAVRCGTTATAIPAEAARLAPEDSVIEARIVFVTFPDSPDSTLPAWADSMATELADYVLEMSGGRTRLSVSLVRRDDAPDLMWRAARPAADYAGPSGLGWARANRDVLAAIAAARPGVWTDVEHVWVLHDQCVFGCTDASSRDACEDTCPWAGIATLGLPSGSVAGLTGDGTTQRFLIHLPPARQHRVQLSVAVHEFGHRVRGTPHSPGSDDPSPGWINYGRYDVMRSGVNGSLAREEGLVPYHPLTLAAWGWRPTVRVDADVAGLRVPDFWSPRGAVLDVRSRRSTQSFALVHHGAGSPYARRGDGSGLHVWHVRRDATGTTELARDLESAAGRKVGEGPPDAIGGRDPLEADPFDLGSAADFFRPERAADFSPLTNPASGLYATDARVSPETMPSGVAIENLRTDPATGDLVVDVWVTPAQEIEPWSRTAFVPGDTLVLRWRPRASAMVGHVRVDLLRGDGSERPLAPALPNDGAFPWIADEVGDSLKLRLTSFDDSGAWGARTSVPFRVARGPAPAPSLRFSAPRPQPARGSVTLSFELPRATVARLEIFDAAGRLVRVLANGTFAPGPISIAWDGLDARGRRVRPGVFLARLVADGARLERRVVWLP